jgi:hypothetical protein
MCANAATSHVSCATTFLFDPDPSTQSLELLGMREKHGICNPDAPNQTNGPICTSFDRL